MSKIIIKDTLATSIQGMSIEAYCKEEGWSKDHVFQRAVIDQTNEHYAELVSLDEKVKKAKDTVELVFNAWLEGNQHLSASLGHDKAMWVNKIAHDAYDSVQWSDIIDVGHRKAIRTMFKGFAKSEFAKVYRNYYLKRNQLRDKINEQAIKFVDGHVSAEVAKLKEEIHAMIGCALVECCYRGAEVTEVRQASWSTGHCINYAIMHDDFIMDLDEVAEHDKRNGDKVASHTLVLSVCYEGDGRQNHLSGDKDSAIREISICHINKHEEEGKEIRYLVEQDTIRIRNGNSDVRFSTKDAKQLKRLKFLFSALFHIMLIKHNCVWARQDWMNDVHLAK